ncbi:MAG TPA: hypothetical protein VJN70_17100 [Gemmatimonadaceae bacterium]|nr:hypothetical protein [Gemmatimonadaceae bacterium]
MGSTYANVLLREPDIDAIAERLDQLRRRAYVAGDGMVSVVYDERADERPDKELERLAMDLSSRLGRTALTVANFDDDVLQYQLVQNGRVADRYDSYPGFLKKGRERPEGGDAHRLCVAFGAPEQEQAVAALLRQTRFEVGPEIERHEQLLTLLRLPANLALLGYGYVRQGEFDRSAHGVKLLTIGGAPEPAVSERAGAQTTDAPSIPAELAPFVAESREQRFYTAALLLSDIDVPARYETLLGRGRVNGYVARHRLLRHILAYGKELGTGLTRVDDLVAELLGAREFPLFAADGLLVRALGVPTLTAAEKEEYARRGSAFHKRCFDALRRAAAQARKIGPLVG